MKSMPLDILRDYDALLKLRGVPFFAHPVYRKWATYFFDFQAKYPLPPERSVQVRLFSEKLRAKGQAERQVEQAADAVSLLFAVQQKRKDSSLSSRADVTPAVMRDFPEKEHEQRSTPTVSSKAELICEPPGPRMPDGHGRRGKGTYDDWRCLRRSAYSAWDTVIGQLVDEIKARHYSRKTLQHYAN